MVNDTFYYGIRKINARKENGKLIVEDDKILEKSLQVTVDYKKGNSFTLYDSEGNSVGDFEFGEKIKTQIKFALLLNSIHFR